MLYKIKFTALWLLAGGSFLIYKSMALKENAYNASLLTEEEFTYPFVFAIFAILALLLKGNWHRKTNIIAGFIVGGVQIIVFIDGITSYPSSPFNILTIVSILILALLVFLAFKLPKQEETK